jgi:hypothetical protein
MVNRWAVLAVAGCLVTLGSLRGVFRTLDAPADERAAGLRWWLPFVGFFLGCLTVFGSLFAYVEWGD